MELIEEEQDAVQRDTPHTASQIQSALSEAAFRARQLLTHQVISSALQAHDIAAKKLHQTWICSVLLKRLVYKSWMQGMNASSLSSNAFLSDASDFDTACVCRWLWSSDLSWQAFYCLMQSQHNNAAGRKVACSPIPYLLDFITMMCMFCSRTHSCFSVLNYCHSQGRLVWSAKAEGRHNLEL